MMLRMKGLNARVKQNVWRKMQYSVTMPFRGTAWQELISLIRRCDWLKTLKDITPAALFKVSNNDMMAQPIFEYTKNTQRSFSPSYWTMILLELDGLLARLTEPLKIFFD